MDDGRNSLMPNSMNSKKILIFGVFDGIHEGHLSFINEAKKHGNQLVAVVARDTIIEKIKGKKPKFNEVERIKNLLEVYDIDLVLLGDPQTETYNVLKEVNPDIIFLGYDQHALHENLLEKIKSGYLNNIELIIGSPHKPDTHHSSILNKK